MCIWKVIERQWAANRYEVRIICNGYECATQTRHLTEGTQWYSQCARPATEIEIKKWNALLTDEERELLDPQNVDKKPDFPFLWYKINFLAWNYVFENATKEEVFDKIMKEETTLTFEQKITVYNSFLMGRCALIDIITDKNTKVFDRAIIHD